MPSAIPGFDQASAQEQWERNSAHLRLPDEVCGVWIRQMTPLDVCKLHVAKSPFMVGGVIGYEHIAQFLFILHDASRLQSRGWFKGPRFTMNDALEKATDFSIEDGNRQISEYLEVTYRDQPTGAREMRDAPIAPSVAWLLHRMSCQPFCWSDEKTYHEPLRLIYQRIRCWQDENGTPVANRLSQKFSDAWVQALQKALDSGEVKLNEWGYPPHDWAPKEVYNG